MKKSFNALLNKKMTRYEFFLHLGILIIGTFGFSNIIKNTLELSYKSKNKSSKSPIKGRNFGSGAYGI